MRFIVRLLLTCAVVTSFVAPASALADGSGGTGQAQLSGQTATTLQAALSSATASQNAVSSNAPVNVAGGNITGGSSSANQTAINGAVSAALNVANTNQSNSQTQSAGSSGCTIGCGGAGQAQINYQQALTAQLAASEANACQNAVNANVPVNIAGGDIIGGTSAANQTAGNGALSGAGNAAGTGQDGNQQQSDG
jgi:hypothetical protein